MERPHVLGYDLIIYHGGCPDGLAGAWCFWQAMNKDDSKFHPGRFNEQPPDVTGKNVLFIDFTYPLDKTKEMLKTAKYIRILDHHKTALRLQEITSDNFSLHLDMNRSGAQLAWDEIYSNYFENYKKNNNSDTIATSANYNPISKVNSITYYNSGRPWFIDDIADRDLWKWSIPQSKQTTRAMFGFNYYANFNTFDTLSTLNRKRFSASGEYLITADSFVYNNIAKRAIDCHAVSLIEPETKWKVRVVECDHTQSSDVGNLLVEDMLCDFAAMYRYDLRLDEWWVSLRANIDSKIDLTEVVKHFGNGGGHPKAAGFTIHGKDNHNLQTIFKPVPRDQRFTKINNTTSDTLTLE